MRTKSILHTVFLLAVLPVLVVLPSGFETPGVTNVVQHPVEPRTTNPGTLPYAVNSVLSSGTWIKLAVSKSGIYQITYEDLQSYGINPGSVDPRNIRIYGNGPGMLPEPNVYPRPDDLTENAIKVVGEEDGIFDTDDHILFYGASQLIWTYNPFNGNFEHTANLYSDYTFYFLTADLGPGKRIQTIESTDKEPTDIVTRFDDYALLEEDLVNLVKSGKEWYGKKFDITDSVQTATFDFPDHDTLEEVRIRILVAARSTVKSEFKVIHEQVEVAQASVNAIQPNSTTVFARKSLDNASFKSDQDQIELKIIYFPPTTTSFGWLNFLEVNTIRHLFYRGGQLSFRNTASAGREKITEFRVPGAGSQTSIWETTRLQDVSSVGTSLAGDTLTFRLPTDSLRQFIAFDGTSFLKPVSFEPVPNQNLHGQLGADMIIVSPPLFLDHARQLADIHQTRDQLSSLIVTPGQIYHEFSSGAKDIAAIRDFARMIFLKTKDTKPLRYLLLFGDGSFDPKERITPGSDLIPTFQSAESLLLTSSFVSDDFYGLFDEEEGSDAHGILDIGIGRFPVNTLEEADHILHKIEFYLNHKELVLGDWRNYVCFLADDEDINLHLNQAEELANFVDSAYNQYNIDKIYFDAFPQISTPTGPRYPDANAALNRRMEEGALIINYTGHGGETGWAGERVLEASDIYSWTNIDRLPLFLTATCEFSRFDDHERTSAGELVFLNNNGGGIALITTTRLAFAQSNFVMNTRFYRYVFEKIDGQYPRLGDLIRLSKSHPDNDNVRNIVLLGDPALQLAYPQHKVVTTAIHGWELNSSMAIDTISALSRITVSGEIQDESGEWMSTFNGTLFPVVYDKPVTIHTLVNDPRSRPGQFDIRKEILFKGNVTVEEGMFSFTFLVPKDISLNFGTGRISYYAMDGVSDATGYYEDFILGGLAQDALPDNQGPDIQLYLNDPVFRQGDVVNSEPILLAYLQDESGINALGNSIGHDIIAILDEDSDHALVLNEYFVLDRDSYQSGTISFRLPKQEEGTHLLTFKAWDLQNNSSTVTIHFHVSDTIPMTVQNLMNYPNPFRDYTYFTFEHNQFNEDLRAEINIYSITGSLVHTIGPIDIMSDGYQGSSLFWDGNSQQGTRVPPGLYVYHLILDNHKGSWKQTTGKLIVLD